MKRWKTTLAVSAALSASLALADDIKTNNGKEYKNATVSRVEPDGIMDCRRCPSLTFRIVHQIQGALVEVKPLINIGNARISAESVKKVNEITTRFGNDIIKKD